MYWAESGCLILRCKLHSVVCIAHVCQVIAYKLASNCFSTTTVRAHDTTLKKAPLSGVYLTLPCTHRCISLQHGAVCFTPPTYVLRWKVAAKDRQTLFFLFVHGSVHHNILWNSQQMQLYAVNFIPLLSSLYMFRASYTPVIRSTMFNCIYSHWYKP